MSCCCCQGSNGVCCQGTNCSSGLGACECQQQGGTFRQGATCNPVICQDSQGNRTLTGTVCDCDGTVVCTVPCQPKTTLTFISRNAINYANSTGDPTLPDTFSVEGRSWTLSLAGINGDELIYQNSGGNAQITALVRACSFTGRRALLVSVTDANGFTRFGSSFFLIWPTFYFCQGQPLGFQPSEWVRFELARPDGSVFTGGFVGEAYFELVQ